jgi:hypothetical protein
MHSHRFLQTCTCTCTSLSTLTMHQAEATSQASAAGYRSATTVDGTRQLPVLFLMPRPDGDVNGDDNGPKKPPPRDIGMSHPVSTAMLLVCRFGIESS